MVPAGASTSCVLARIRSPERSSVPIRTRSTSAWEARASRSGVSEAKRAPTALERRTTDGSPESEAETASASANDRKSTSGSARRTRKGRTTSRVSGLATEAAPPAAPEATASSSARKSAAEAGRSSGRLASARRRARSSATTAGSPLRAGGCSCRVAESTSTTVLPRKAGRPDTASYRMAAVENRSVRASTAWPSTCSGAMYRGVPTSRPGRVSSVPISSERVRSLGSARARPKSSTFTPWGERNTFEGLRSRWTTPAAWSAARAERIDRPTPTASATGSGPRASRSDRGSPSSSSIAMKSWPRSSPIS